MSNDINKRITRIRQNKKKNAKNRGIEFTLTPEQFYSLYTEKYCFYTGVELTEENRSIDRIESDKGYTADNVVACDKDFNKRKNDITVQDINILYHKFVELNLIKEKPLNLFKKCFNF